jgi:hypothetical protein
MHFCVLSPEVRHQPVHGVVSFGRAEAGASAEGNAKEKADGKTVFLMRYDFYGHVLRCAFILHGTGRIANAAAAADFQQREAEAS